MIKCCELWNGVTAMDSRSRSAGKDTEASSVGIKFLDARLLCSLAVEAILTPNFPRAPVCRPVLANQKKYHNYLRANLLQDSSDVSETRRYFFFYICHEKNTVHHLLKVTHFFVLIEFGLTVILWTLLL